MKTISVVTATYPGQVGTLPLLYESLKGQQTYFKEWIICNDSLEKNTMSRMIDSFVRTAPFTVKSFSQEHKGMRLARNINKGLKAATGDVIFIVMGDSYLFPDTLEQIQKTFNPTMTAGCGMRVNIDKDGNFVSYDWRVGNTQGLIINVTAQKDYYKYLTGNGMIVSRQALQNIGYWDEKYEGYGRDDWDVYVKLYRSGLNLFQYNNVKINHVEHGPGQPDNPKNVERFNNLLNI